MDGKFCQACGMPLDDQADCAGGDRNADFCIHCVDDKGRVRSCAEIFEGGVCFFIHELAINREMAERITRKNMLAQPYWQNRNCPELEGETASDAEFQDALKKLAG